MDQVFNLTLNDVWSDELLQCGLFLVRGDEATEMQKDWDDEDAGKNIDFGDDECFWLFTDSGDEPELISDIHEISEYLATSDDQG